MLITCPECAQSVSDKAISCPHCGYPLKSISQKSPPRKNQPKKRPRLPNGFGQITEIKDQNLRNRFRVIVSDGKTEFGRPIQKLLKPRAYFPTYKEAYEALLEYHKNPYELDKDLTVEKLYEKWLEKYKEKSKGTDSAHIYVTTWLYCDSLKNIKVRDLRPRHIKYCLEHGIRIKDGIEYSIPITVKPKIKMMFNLMLDYAVEYELVEKNYARDFRLSEEITEAESLNRKSHLIFSDEEMDKLWENINLPDIDTVLIQCYMGWRPQELGLLEISNVHLDQNYIIGGLKTKAGKNRIVPIHPKVLPLIESKLKTAEKYGSDKLILSKDRHKEGKYRPLTYDKYFKRFREITKELSLDPKHKPHDPRKQFVTMAKKYKVDEYAIKRIVGHTIKDVTEAVYTERDPAWLYEEVCKIP